MVLFSIGKTTITDEKLDEVIEKIKRVLKEELPEDCQTGEMLDYILSELKERKKSWKVEL